MVNILQAVYIATAAMLLMALIRFIGSRRATGEDRLVLTEKARRYFILAGVMGIASLGGYTVLDQSAAQDEWTLVPGRGAVGIGPNVSHAMLLARLDDSLVRVSRLPADDGSSVPGTVLFPDDSLQRLEILWQDTTRFERPAVLRVRGTASRWRLQSGTALGSRAADGSVVRELHVTLMP